jgi:hypothetical protein
MATGANRIQRHHLPESLNVEPDWGLLVARESFELSCVRIGKLDVGSFDLMN